MKKIIRLISCGLLIFAVLFIILDSAAKDKAMLHKTPLAVADKIAVTGKNDGNIAIKQMANMEEDKTAFVNKESREPAVVPGEVIVRLKSENVQNQLQDVADKIKEVAHGPVYTKITFKEGVNQEQVIEQLQKEQKIDFAQPVHVYKISAVLNDPDYGSQWYMPLINAPKSYDISGSLNAVKVAVVDTGVAANHPDLSGKVIAEYDAINRIAGTGRAMDVHGHGTHVAGIIAARANNGAGIAGIAPNAQILAVKAAYPDGSLYDFDIVNGIHWAVQNGAKVINMSFGSSGYSQVIANEINYAYSQGVVLVAAAGNNGVGSVSYPAALPGVIGVSATANDDTLAEFSNYGPEIDVAAPGVDIFSTYYDTASHTNDYAYMSGTSMAAPMVAAEAAVLLGYNPTMTAAKVADTIRKNSLDLGTVGFDNYFGNGRIDIAKALMPMRMWVDTPVNGATVRGTAVPVKGWALNMSGISKVEVLKSNGALLPGTAVIGTYKAGLNAVFPGYPGGDNNGFTYNLNTTLLPNGWQTLTVKATGVNGDFTTFAVRLYINNSPMRMWVDTPVNGATVRGTAVPVKGWALNMSGISKVEVLKSNGALLPGKAVIGTYKAGLNAVFPGYPGGNNNGFTYNLNTTPLPNGWQTLTVKATGVNGEILTFIVKVYVDNAPKMWVDTPVNGATVRGTAVPVKGWALNMSGISKIEVLKSNGTLLPGTAVIGTYKAGLNAVLPGYPGGDNNGFTYNLNTTLLPNGWQTLTVRATGKNGQTTAFAVKLNINNSPMRMWVDTPVNGAIVRGTAVPVKGWALNMSGISKVEVLKSNGALLPGTAVIGTYKAGLNAVFPGYPGGDNNGFTYNLNTTLLPNGWQTLTVRAAGVNGEKQNFKIIVYINN